MNIALLMAAIAGSRREHLVTVHRLLVTIEAFRLLVGTVDLVFGALVMVEVPSLPVARIVTAVTLLAQP